jgi:EmrB/QacA subfamily drug resistance transporter
MAAFVKPPCDEAVILTGSSGDCERSRGRWVLAATILGSSLAFIDGTVVNVALPALQTALGATLADVQWVVEAYALTLSALLLTGGSLGDLRGRRRIFTLGVVIFAVCSALCGLAATINQLIIARALQGIGAALMVPNSLALISASFSPADRGKAIGTWSGSTSITTALGPVVGGWLVQHVSWRWVFFINLPLATAVVIIAMWRVPETRATGDNRRVDWPAVALTASSLGAIVYALIESVPLAGAIGVILLIAFFVVEARSAAPMLPLALFRAKSFAGANLLTLLLYAALSGVLFFYPLNLIQVQGYSPTAAGAALLPFILLMFLLSRWSGGLVQRYGSHGPLIVGPLVAAAGLALFALPGIGGSYWTTGFPAVVVLGLGMAIAVAPLTTTVMNSVDQERAGIASGINNAVSRVAGLLAIAILGAVVYSVFSRTLARELTAMHVPAAISEPIMEQRRNLAATQTGDPRGREAIQKAFLAGYRRAIWIGVGLACGSAVFAWALIRPEPTRSW